MPLWLCSVRALFVAIVYVLVSGMVALCLLLFSLYYRVGVRFVCSLFDMIYNFSFGFL